MQSVRIRNRGSRLGAVAACALAGFCATSAARAVRLDELEEMLRSHPHANAKRGLFRVYAVEALTRDETDRGLEQLARLFARELENQRAQRLAPSRMALLQKAADAALLLRFSHGRASRPLRRDVARWLFASDRRLSVFLETVTAQDDWENCRVLLETLYDNDAEGRDEFLNLILALAVVWDQPRPEMHGQMGGNRLPFEVDAVARYDYFKRLYASREAKLQYRDLSVIALTFVVDVPVPLEELQWALKNVRGSARMWKTKFSAIEYARERVARGEYQWQHGPYTLAAIRENGGICVDQAYYATLSARAHGIPALLFAGEGRRGPHAWFGYLKDRSHWDLDAGRYAYDRYATGSALNPQFNRPMTDHDLEYVCDRALRSARYAKAAGYGRLAAVLLGLDCLDTAAQSAEEALSLVRIYALPWQVLEEVLAKKDQPEELLALMDRQANAFRNFPDQLALIRQRQAELLTRLGREREAARLLERSENRLDRERDDLERFLGSEQVRLAMEKGDHKSARTKLEQLLRDQKNEGQKIMRLVQAYLELTRETGQTKEAARFLRNYVRALQRRYGGNPRNDTVFLRLLLQAYENDGDERNAERVSKKIERLR